MVCDLAAEVTTEPGLPAIRYSERVSDAQCQSSPPQIHCCAWRLNFAKARGSRIVQNYSFPDQMHRDLHGFSAYQQNLLQPFEKLSKQRFQGKNLQFCIGIIYFLLYWNRQHKNNCFGINKGRRLE